MPASALPMWRAALPLPMPVAGNAPRGAWKLEVLADPAAAPLAVAQVVVEDFLPERIDFDLTVPDVLTLGDWGRHRHRRALSVRRAGRRAAAEGEVLLREARELPGYPGYRFGVPDAPFSLQMFPLCRRRHHR
jgi:alpha-2-macroglobulin